MYGSTAGLAGSMYNADTSRANTLSNVGASMYGSNLGLAGQMYNADTSRANTLTNADTQRYGYDTGLFGNIYNANAGMFNNLNNNATTRYGQDQSFYTNMRGQDLTQMQLGGNMLNSGVTGAAGMGQGVYNVGNTTMQAPANMMTNYNNIMQPVLNTTGTGTTTAQGSQVAGAAGGAIMGSQVSELLRNGLISPVNNQSTQPNYMGSSVNYPSNLGFNYNPPW
jgi:hypothetical protein